MRFVAILPDYHGISRWPVAEPFVKDRKHVQGVYWYTVPDAGGGTRIVIWGLRFYDDFWYFFFNTFMVTALLLLLLLLLLKTVHLCN